MLLRDLARRAPHRVAQFGAGVVPEQGVHGLAPPVLAGLVHRRVSPRERHRLCVVLLVGRPIAGVRVGLRFQQQQRGARVAGARGVVQGGVAAARLDAVVRPGSEQLADHRGLPAHAGAVQRCVPVLCGRGNIGLGVDDPAGDRNVPAVRGTVERSAAVLVQAVWVLALLQQLADRVAVAGRRGVVQGVCAAHDRAAAVPAFAARVRRAAARAVLAAGVPVGGVSAARIRRVAAAGRRRVCAVGSGAVGSKHASSVPSDAW